MSKEVYSKLTPREHVLHRPGMYIGSTSLTTENKWVINDDKFELQEVSFIPGILKIFDEAITNVADHYIKYPKEVNNVTITIPDDLTESITVSNNGPGIPIETNSEGVYIPQMIFSELLSGSNYNDDIQRQVAGTNGLGIKLLNIFSKEFVLECVTNGVKFKQTYSNNNSKASKPKITTVKTKDSVKISFKIDWDYFKVNDMKIYHDLFISRVYEILVVMKNTNIILNKNKLPKVKKFVDFVKLFPFENVYNFTVENIELVIVNESRDCISWVNGNFTKNNGKHIDTIYSNLHKELVKKRDFKDIKLKDLKDNLMFCVNCTVANPEFSSQSKEQLTTNVKWDLKYDAIIKKLLTTEFKEKLLAKLSSKDNKELEKVSKKTSIKIPNFEDALYAGKKECTLFLTEGLSARSFVISGLSELERNYYGVMPLKGKILNTRDASTKQITNNTEISNIVKAVGLKFGEKYNSESIKKLRYQRICIATDSDCFAHDTPLLLLDSNNNYAIENISDIATEWLPEIDGVSYAKDINYKIYSDTGFVKILSLTKKKTTKKMYRICTHTGVIDITEDHPLLKENLQEIKVCDVTKDILLKHSFPEIKKGVQEPITIQEAYAMGLFVTDGTCGIYKWKYNYKPKNRPKMYTFNRNRHSWAISNTNLEYLEKAKNGLSHIYPYEFKIIEDRHNHVTKGYTMSYKLIVNGESKIQSFIEKYRNLFYDNNKQKRIPNFLFNATDEIKEAFLQGVYDGDGDKSGKKRKGTNRICVNGKIMSQGLYFLYKSLGYNVSLNIRNDKMKVYSLGFTKNNQTKNPNIVKKIMELGITEEYVYDIETENHHLQAGVGQMIVHNCDGIHITGLFVNFIHYFWPSLLDLGFIYKLKTPLIKVTTKDNKIIPFYTQKEYNDSKETLDIKKVKYFKGLGTSTSQEAKEIFKDYEKQIQEFTKDSNTDHSINLAFEKSQANNRKEWLTNFIPSQAIETFGLRQLSYSDFINNDLITFSLYDCQRSIPNVLDGFKPSTRKVFYTMLNSSSTEIKVAQLAAKVAQATNYHHGEVSLFGAIVGMAQDYPGSNNINLLEPIGQFGSRLSLGKDSASPRYIFTKLNEVTKYIYLDSDIPLLTQIVEENELIEPYYYVPVIPMVLVNGAIGIGTGFSTNVNTHNPIEICEAILRILDKKSPKSLSVYFKGFKGTIENSEIKGVHEVQGKHTIITEIPVGISISDFSDALSENYNIIDNKSTENTIYFKIKGTLDKEFIDKWLTSKLKPETNMWLFNELGKLVKFTDTESILNYFVKFRLDFYKQKQSYLLKKINEELTFLNEKMRFIDLVLRGFVSISKLNKTDLITSLKMLEFQMEHIQKFINLPMYTLTKDTIAKLRENIKDKESEYNEILSKSNVEMYKCDIQNLLNKLK